METLIRNRMVSFVSGFDALEGMDIKGCLDFADKFVHKMLEDAPVDTYLDNLLMNQPRVNAPCLLFSENRAFPQQATHYFWHGDRTLIRRLYPNVYQFGNYTGNNTDSYILEASLGGTALQDYALYELLNLHFESESNNRKPCHMLWPLSEIIK